MRLVWTRQASAQLADAHEYLQNENSSAADRQLLAVTAAVGQLAQYPEMGRPGRVRGTRELVIAGTPLLAAYRVRQERIEILAILHGARRWPARF